MWSKESADVVAGRSFSSGAKTLRLISDYLGRG
jgi:hypothetical protein